MKLFLILVTLFSTGMMGTRMLIPLVSQNLGASILEIGIIVALFSIIPLFFSIRIGKWIDSTNFKIPIYLSLSLVGVGLVLPFLFNHILSVIFSQFFTGIAQTIFALSGQRYAGLAFGNEKRDQAIAQFSLGIALGSFIGPIIAGSLSDISSYSTTFGILAMCSFSAIFFVFSLADSSKSEEKKMEIAKEKSSTFLLLKNKQLRKAIIISSIVLFAKEIFIAYFPLYGDEIGLSSTIIGIVISLHTLAQIIVRTFLKFLLENYSISRLVNSSVIVSVILLLSFPIFDEIVIITLLSFALGIGLGLGQPLSIMMTIHALPHNHTGAGLGLRITFNRLTQTAAPIVLGGVASLFGVISVFGTASLIILGLQLIYLKVK